MNVISKQVLICEWHKMQGLLRIFDVVASQHTAALCCRHCARVPPCLALTHKRGVCGLFLTIGALVPTVERAPPDNDGSPALFAALWSLQPSLLAGPPGRSGNVEPVNARHDERPLREYLCHPRLRYVLCPAVRTATAGRLRPTVLFYWWGPLCGPSWSAGHCAGGALHSRLLAGSRRG